MRNKVFNFKDAAADPALVDQKKFNWLEYYKVSSKQIGILKFMVS
jgi:outer membrane protein insertion porin family